ncbi:DUF4855 domain-containing protein [Aneurinibacillus tyrosinisolvens]|uniref:DUF4855 domain-containing protein n=1 Tax=Aneurinibacillus tyrosinisolvens TaxID=1443435 RepID=UPI00063F3680|nr:DUF4855 domain-containing protein [Aneurinibacillus tyrosinisolvens]
MLNTSPLGYLSSTDSPIQNHICMLPCGGLLAGDKQSWNAADLQPYVSYMINGKGIDRMFGGFIFNSISIREGYFIYPLYVGFGKPADHIDWLQWIEALFAPEQNFQALLLTSPKSPLDVWVSIPYPYPPQDNFGVIENQNLNFKSDDHRYIAVTWWIDRFLDRWKAETSLHSKLNFRGFHWQREAIDPYDAELVKRVNGYIRTKGLYSMWLPNYGSYGVTTWKELGFDVTAINPNYYGNTSYDYQWITYASHFSKFYHTGLQITFGKGLLYSDTHLLDYLNLGLPEKNNYMKESIIVYQFPNQIMKEIYQTRFVDYIRLYTFIRGLYTKISYPEIKY